MRQAISVPRANLISLGICLGKFSKTEKFRLHITGLDLLGRYAKNKVSLLLFFQLFRIIINDRLRQFLDLD